MPRTTIARSTVTGGITLNGLVTEADADQANGNSFDNTDGNALLVVRNTTGGSITITVTSVADPATARVGDISQAVAAGAFRVFGKFPPRLFNQSDGTVQVSSSVGTGVKVSVVVPA